MEIIAGTTATTMATQSITPKDVKFDRPFSLIPSQPIRTSLRFPTISRKPCITTRCVADDTTSKVAAEDPCFAVKKKAADISTELKGTSIFLVGMNNAIKTHLGKFLADALRYYYFDSDSLVFEAAGGESAAKAFRESDERGYQQAETEVLKQLSSMGRLVVCAGNGAVQSSTNLALLRHGISLWIDVPPGMVARLDRGRLPESEVSKSRSYTKVLPQLFGLYKEMRDGYATADATVSLQKVASQLGYDDLDAVTTEDMTLEVLKEIEKLTRKKQMMEQAARPF